MPTTEKMTDLYQNLQKNKKRILDIASQYHATNVRVFGSVVHTEEREDSDIDLLVDFEPGSTLFDQAGMIEALTLVLGRKVDVVNMSILWNQTELLVSFQAINGKILFINRQDLAITNT